MKIIPTVGRIVWFYRDFEDRENAAIVCAVSGDGAHVNLVVFNHRGETRPETGVQVIQEDMIAPVVGRFCKWMPYQIGQAKKHEKESTGDTATETT